MNSEKLKSHVELFICNHKRDDGECCFDKGAKELTDTLKIWSKEFPGKEIKIYRSGCLSKCEAGIAMACYPAKELFTDVKKDDVEEIKKGLKEALSKLRS